MFKIKVLMTIRDVKAAMKLERSHSVQKLWFYVALCSRARKNRGYRASLKSRRSRIAQR